MIITLVILPLSFIYYKSKPNLKFIDQNVIFAK